MTSAPAADSRRILWVSFDGTLAGGFASSRETVVSVLPTLISKAHNVIPINFSGVGSDDSWYDLFWGGVCGWGTRRNVISAYRAWAARYLSLILSIVGLPVHGDNEFFHALYRECKENPNFESFITQILVDYERHTDVEVEAQCCFDTVGSLGLPLFGLAKPLAFLRRGKSKDSSVSTVPNNVKYSFHALSLHETREPFSPTYMTGENVHQVFFLGNHGDLGWVVVGQESFVHAALAWMIQQLHSHSKIEFDDDKLKRYFNSYLPDLVPTSDGSGGTTIPSAHYGWATGHFTRTSPALLAIMGKKVRKPYKLALGRRALEGGPDGSESPRISACAAHHIPEIQIHIGARESTEENVVPGYTLKAPIKGQPYWARRGSSNRSLRSRNHSRDCVRVQELNEPSRLASLPESETASSHEQAHDHMYEAAVGRLEALLLGLPAELVSAEPCCKGLSERN
ncbi:uncharacterized protein FIESC28_10761 [Fusarium coffeatum]|uniref:T6SS Phospholipase effector Tle1-like catalytic domain-containing protein n=1 Tax=Fusarium coffeatum TaxID=231269 RepID=A0A366QRA5_9HYPO|nr:uncharacterized protein FIESC28_10761 [Fusarium coffeatum]RBR07262.1 hypothetical protein FIESC28_10761 [Fusarium coffeatum]